MLVSQGRLKVNTIFIFDKTGQGLVNNTEYRSDILSSVASVNSTKIQNREF